MSTRTEAVLDTSAYSDAETIAPLRTQFPLREIIPIVLIIAVDFMGFGIVVPLLPSYTERTGASAFTVGLLISAFAFCQFVAGPLLGQLSDRIGRKPVLILSQFGSFAGYVLFALSHSLWLIFVSRIVDGLSAGNMSVAQAYVSDKTEPSQRTRAFGLVGAAFGVGTMVGPALGGLLSSRNVQAPLWVAAGLSFVTMVLTWFLLPKTAPRTPKEPSGPFALQSITTTFRSESTKQIAWLMTAFYFALSTYMSGQALFLAGRFTFNNHPFTPENIGLVFTYIAAINILVQLFLMKPLTRHLDEERLLALGFLLMGIGFLGVIFCNAVPALMMFLSVANIGASILRPLVLSQLSRRVGMSGQGAVMGVNQSVFSLCAILAPLLSGGLINSGMYSQWALAVGCFACVGLVAAIRLTPSIVVLNK